MFSSFGGYLIYIALLMIIPMLAQSKVKNTYKIYSKKPTSSMMSGAQVARKILDENGLYDVNVEETKGFLSDHYDPRKKVVRLSSNNYHGQSMASSAVAAHEVGHAIQDQQEYAFLRFRTALVPVASLGSNMSIFLILGGILLNFMNFFFFEFIFFSSNVWFYIIILHIEYTE